MKKFISIESQPKKFVVAVVVVVIFFVVVGLVFGGVLGHRNLSLKFCQNWLNKKRKDAKKNSGIIHSGSDPTHPPP